MISIKAADPYTAADLDYGDDESRVTKEHESAGSPAKSSVRPKISNLKSIKKAVKKRMSYISVTRSGGERLRILSIRWWKE